MKILYGVVGEEWVMRCARGWYWSTSPGQGRRIVIMASGRANSFLAKALQGVNKIHGFHMIGRRTASAAARPLWSNVCPGDRGAAEHRHLAHQEFGSPRR